MIRNNRSVIMRSKREISERFYYFILSFLTNIIYLSVLIAVFRLSSLLITDVRITIILISGFLIKGVMVGVIMGSKYSYALTREFRNQFIGLYFGRFYGLFMGAFLGAKIGNVISDRFGWAGLIFGATFFYFLGRWQGSKLSIGIGIFLDRIFTTDDIQKPERNLVIKKTIKYIAALFILIIPLTIITIGWLIARLNFPRGYFTGFLLVIRFIAIAVSLLAFGYPWFRSKSWSKQDRMNNSNEQSTILWAGLGLSVVPAVYGFVLFLAFGAPLWELTLFSAASSAEAIIWTVIYRSKL